MKKWRDLPRSVGFSSTRTRRSASSAVAESVAYPERQMTAAELAEFWKSARIMARPGKTAVAIRRAQRA